MEAAVLDEVEIRVPAKHVEAIRQELESMAMDIKDEISDLRKLDDSGRDIPEGWSIVPLELRVESLQEVTRRFMKAETGEGSVLSGGPMDRAAMAEILYAAMYDPASELAACAEQRQASHAEVTAGIDRLAWLRDCLEQLGEPDRGSDLRDE